MTRQQAFAKLCRELSEACVDGSEDGYKRYETAQRALARYVWRHEGRITVASNPPKERKARR